MHKKYIIRDNGYMKRVLTAGFVALAGLGVGIALISCGSKDHSTHEAQENIDFYTCGMHPSVRVSPEEYNKGSTQCPICNMGLTPIYKKESKSAVKEHDEHGAVQKKSDDEISSNTKVQIKKHQADLAGVQSEPAEKLHLSKEIRAVGKIAYDPELAVAQEEYLSILKTLDKMTEEVMPEIKERTENLLLSAEKKLLLQGLSKPQIEQLKKTRIVQENLTQPEKKMWVYGEVYEYELSWIKIGGALRVNTTSIPGKEYLGTISSINPTVNPNTRSVRFRALIDNTDLALKPEMYVNITIQSMYKAPDGSHLVLAIPKDAVLDTGSRQVVWVDTGEGSYESRTVEIGPEATAENNGKYRKYYPVLRGIKEHEKVVTKANFLIDSQSQLSGAASAAYGGTLDGDAQGGLPAGLHQH
ncbi:MAG: efflux RND transporter periplasmic adaptor subunit [bacterium]